MADNPRIDDLRKRLDREPGSRVFAQLAEELRKAGQLPESIRVARQGLLVHPTYPSARMTLGRALMDLRDLRGARAEFEAVLRGASDNILASRYLGECLEGLGDLGSALLQYRATLRLAPGDRNLEAQIRALEQKLTPAAITPPASAPLLATARPAVLPRAGAIPVLDVDGPMELETSFEKTIAWRPPAAPPALEVEDLPTLGAMPPAEPTAADANSIALPVDGAQSMEALVGEDTSVGTAGEPAAASGPAADESQPGAEPLDQRFPDEGDGRRAAAQEAVPSSPTNGEPPALSSSTLAELYFNQGFTRQAIDVYRELLEREPGNERIEARIAELEALDRELDPAGPIAPALVAALPKAARREAIERTITRLEAFLAAVRRA